MNLICVVLDIAMYAVLTIQHLQYVYRASHLRLTIELLNFLVHPHCLFFLGIYLLISDQRLFLQSIEWWNGNFQYL